MMYVATFITTVGLLYGISSLRNRDKFVGTFAMTLIISGLGTILITHLAYSAINTSL